ncbi:MAG: DUF3313 domain-containing protein, partial [Steroidobacteraceae bacterium]
SATPSARPQRPLAVLLPRRLQRQCRLARPGPLPEAQPRVAGRPFESSSYCPLRIVGLGRILVVLRRGASHSCRGDGSRTARPLEGARLLIWQSACTRTAAAGLHELDMIAGISYHAESGDCMKTRIRMPASPRNSQEKTMKAFRGLTTFCFALYFVSAPATVFAQTQAGSFLSDYSGLTTAHDSSIDRIYIAPDSLSRLAGYKAVMVDQPELAISPDSKYDGMKPDDLKLIADSLRAAVTNELKEGYQIVEAPGPGVLYVRVGVGDLYLKKHKRSIMSYTPAGFLIHSAVGLSKEITDKIDVSKMTIEAEVLDSQSLEQLVAMTTTRGTLDKKAKADATSWDEMTGLFSVLGKRLRCRLDNSRKPESQWASCTNINLPPPAAE